MAVGNAAWRVSTQSSVPVISQPPAWSPDGKTIALTLWEVADGQHPVLKLVSVADGKARNLYTPQPGSALGPPVWLPDGNGLLLAIRAGSPGARGQVWYVRNPSGEVRRFTNDPTDYSTCCLSLTQDGKTLAVMQDSPTADLWVGRAGALDDAQQVSSGEPHALAGWTADGKLLTAGSDGHIETMPPERGSPMHLGLRECQRRLCPRHAATVVTSCTWHAQERLRMCGASTPTVGNPMQLSKGWLRSPCDRVLKSTARVTGNGLLSRRRTQARVQARGECPLRAGRLRNSAKISIARESRFPPMASWSRCTCGERRQPVRL